MMKAPFRGFSPELLAQIAQGAFRPPQAMGMQAPGLPGMGMDGGGGGALGAGMQGLGMGLGMLGKMGGSVEAARTAGDADLGGYSKTGPGGMVDVGGGVMLPNPNRPDSYSAGAGGFWPWLKGLF